MESSSSSNSDQTLGITDIAALALKINELEREINQAKKDGVKLNDPGMVGLRAYQTALQEEKILLIKAQQSSSGTSCNTPSAAFVHGHQRLSRIRVCARAHSYRLSLTLSLLSPSGYASLPVSVRLWDAVDGATSPLVVFLRNITSFDDLKTRIAEEFPRMATAQADGLFQLYYLIDPSTEASRVYVDNDTDLRLFKEQMRDLDQRCRCLIGFVRKVPKGTKGSSPSRLPEHLRIDTTIVNQAPPINTSSAHHLSPPADASPKSPQENRSQSIKAQCIRRHTNDKNELRCLFCGKRCLVEYPRGPSSPVYGSDGEVAHIVSFKVSERRGLPVPDFLLRLGGVVDVLPNVIFLCRNCHGKFDSGNLWVEVVKQPRKKALLKLSVVDGFNDFDELNGEILEPPETEAQRELFPDYPPYDQVWVWHKQWAAKKRGGGKKKSSGRAAAATSSASATMASPASAIADQLGVLSFSSSPSASTSPLALSAPASPSPSISSAASSSAPAVSVAVRRSKRK
jgi:hypothetical protein